MKKDMKKNQELLAAIKAQDPKGLEKAIRRYSSYVAGVISRVLGQLGTREDVEELTSDVFVTLWQSANRLWEDGDLALWLGVVARNHALKHLRSLRLDLPLEEEVLAETGPSPTGLWERREETRQVRDAVDSLEGPDREIFLRHYFWRQNVRQIAEELSMNESTVKSRLKRGREKLRKTLAKEEFT